jgi:hypothetical protein
MVNIEKEYAFTQAQTWLIFHSDRSSVAAKIGEKREKFCDISPKFKHSWSKYGRG